jgi:DNA-binding transcriptional ArsR family regulator
MTKSTNAFLTLMPQENADAISALAGPVRLAILKLLRQSGPMNVNMISAALKLPQSTIATNIKVLEASRLIHTEAAKAAQGTAEDLFGAVRWSADPPRWRSSNTARRSGRGVNADRPLHKLRSECAVRPVLDGRNYRAARRAGLLP